MTGKPENPQAFPVWEFESYGGGAGRHVLTGGMTLRDYFAGEALKGFCANDAKYQRAVEHSKLGIGVAISDIFAKETYSYADAMLKERAK